MAHKHVLIKPLITIIVTISCVVAIVYMGYSFCFYSVEPVTTVLLVRHAEKKTEPPDDPPLTAAGHKRAQALIHVAGEAGVKVIYASQFKRTQQTIEPLKNHLGLTVIKINDYDVDGLVRDILKEPNLGKVVLVAGHSYTLQRIIKGLGGAPIPPIAENEYDNIFIVTIFGVGDVKAKVVNMKYGNPSY